MTVHVDLSGAAESVRAVSSSFPDCVTIALACVFDLKGTKADLNQLADSLGSVQVKTGLNDSKIALNRLASSLSRVQIDTGLEGAQKQIHQAAQQIYQVKTLVEVLVVFFFAISILFTLTGLSFIILVRRTNAAAS